jgi:polycystin 1L2
LCNHLTLFGANVFVPPNTIDFSTVFDDFGSKLVENLHVVLTIALLLLFYFLLLILMRRLDKDDQRKVGLSL